MKKYREVKPGGEVDKWFQDKPSQAWVRFVMELYQSSQATDMVASAERRALPITLQQIWREYHRRNPQLFPQESLDENGDHKRLPRSPTGLSRCTTIPR